jgi:hypothetical protein
METSQLNGMLTGEAAQSTRKEIVQSIFVNYKI